MWTGTHELRHLAHHGHVITIQAVPNGGGGFIIEAVERGDRIGEGVYVAASAPDAVGAFGNFEVAVDKAAVELEDRIKSGALAVPPR